MIQSFSVLWEFDAFAFELSISNVNEHGLVRCELYDSLIFKDNWPSQHSNADVYTDLVWALELCGLYLSKAKSSDRIVLFISNFFSPAFEPENNIPLVMFYQYTA